MKHRILFFILFISLHCSFCTYAQKHDNKTAYERALAEQLQMLNGQKSLDFKRAVFISENAYLNDSLDYNKFCDTIAKIAEILKSAIKERGFEQYKTSGNWAVFSYMMDSSTALNNYKPYIYDFEDFLGDKIGKILSLLN